MARQNPSGVDFGAAAREAQRRDATQIELDAVAGMPANTVLKFGEHQAPSPTPCLIRDLPIPCPSAACAARPLASRLLTAIAYHVFIRSEAATPNFDGEGTFMLWADGLCPACQSRQVVIFDPLDAMSPAATLKKGDETETLVRDWVKQLGEPLDVQVVA